jgi:hypothetical protein
MFISKECQQMFQLDLVPICDAAVICPGNKSPKQRRVGALGVFGLPAFVPQVLKKIFNELLHP